MSEMRVNLVMNRLVATLLALSIHLGPLAARANVVEHAADWNHPAIAWRDMRAGVPEAIRTGKPVLMVMHATWCTACRRYREVFTDERVVRLAQKFVMILVDVQKYPDVNGAFAPDGTYVPRTLFLDAEGEVDTTLVGADPQYPHSLKIDTADELVGLMQRAKSPASAASPAEAQRH